MQLDPKESHYVLQALLARRKVLSRHVREILRSREKEIALLRERLASLERPGGGTGSARTQRPSVGPRRRRHLSPKVLALRRLQGRYMGLVRRLNASQKARVRAVREKKGLPAAIRAASAGRS